MNKTPYREAVEVGAKALAVAIAGGDWSTSYTEGQRQFWRDVVTKGMSE